jgi:hypothetical protein
MGEAMQWIAWGSCDAATQLGWFIGVSTGALAAIVVTILIVTAPPLGAAHPHGVASWRRFRRVLRHLLAAILVVVWIGGGLRVGAEHLSCYAPQAAIGAAILIGLVLMLTLLTAANQIGERSVR